MTGGLQREPGNAAGEQQELDLVTLLLLQLAAHLDTDHTSGHNRLISNFWKKFRILGTGAVGYQTNIKISVLLYNSSEQ